jgi:hypothetical protein
MWNKLLHSPAVYFYLLVGTAASTAIGFSLPTYAPLPILNVFIAYPVMYSLLANEYRKRAISTMLFWALCMAFIGVWAVMHYPDKAGHSMYNGEYYKEQMFHWIKTGVGAEGNPSQFVPQHLIHFIVFCVLSAISAGFLSLLMGAVLMNYMSFYVGSLITASSDTFKAVLMGWHPWAIIRVASYVMLGVILAEPLICKITKRDYNYSEVRPYFWTAISGIALDILMKALLAPTWGLMLRRII